MNLLGSPLTHHIFGAFYHITSRGNERQAIFRSRADRLQFLGYFESAAERYLADIADILAAGPETLIIGAHYAGVMRVLEAPLNTITRRGIHVSAEPTGKAVKTFNCLADGGNTVAGAFHLTF